MTRDGHMQSEEPLVRPPLARGDSGGSSAQCVPTRVQTPPNPPLVRGGFAPPTSARRSALTVIELLVVIIIIAVLASSILVGTSVVLERARVEFVREMAQVRRELGALLLEI